MGTLFPVMTVSCPAAWFDETANVIFWQVLGGASCLWTTNCGYSRGAACGQHKYFFHRGSMTLPLSWQHLIRIAEAGGYKVWDRSAVVGHE
jgi:hypothetical protein